MTKTQIKKACSFTDDYSFHQTKTSWILRSEYKLEGIKEKDMTYLNPLYCDFLQKVIEGINYANAGTIKNSYYIKQTAVGLILTMNEFGAKPILRTITFLGRYEIEYKESVILAKESVLEFVLKRKEH